MSRDVITVGSTMRISLLYQGEYSQWRKRFMNYLEEKTDGEAMINSIQNGNQPLPVIAQVSLTGNTQNAPPTLKDPNNETAKDLWDALERQMRGFKYGEQDRKATILYEYETFKANKGEQLLDTYLRYLQVINDLKKCVYKKDNYELNYNQGDVNDALGYKKKAVVVHSDPLALVAEKTNVSKQKEKVVSSDSKESGADDFSELKKITALLAKDFNRRKFYSKPTNNNLRTSSTSQSANKKQEFVKTNDKKADEKKRDMSKVKCYNCKKEGHFAKASKGLKLKKVLSELDESSSSVEETIAEEKYAKLEAERYEYMIRYYVYFDNDKQHRKQIADQQVLYDKISVQLIELDKHVRDLKNTVLEKDFKISELEECVRNKDLEIEKCLEHLDTFSSVRRPKNSGVIWKKKGSSNTSNVGLSAVSVSNLNKHVKRYSRKDLLACNNSHLGETRSAYVCNDVMNVSCNSRMCDLLDDNNFFIFDDVNVRISLVSKMPIRKKPRDSINVRSKSNMIKSLPRPVH
nr:hypothetical protein [Tanacetum cinerariifolium]